jgi:aspartate/methionine/tyrosine aminotransferase
MRRPFSARLPWPNPPNSLSLEAARLKAASVPLLNFVESNPTRVGLEREGESLLAALSTRASLDYSPNPRGLASSREALAAFLSERSGGGVGFPPEKLFFSASTSEAYGWLFKLLADPGDAVLVPKPGYPLFDFLTGLEAVEARSYRLSYAHPSGWRIDLDSLEEGLARGGVRAIVLINPNNPTGSYVGEEERRRILALASRYGAALIVDEVFLGFRVEAGTTASFLGEDAVLCFVLDGLSKLLGLPQMKLGWIAASGPADLLEEALGRLEIIADSYLSAGSPVMNALPGWLPLVPGFQTALNLRLGANLAALRAGLEGGDSPHRVLRCEGGWTALVEAPRLASEEELALGLLREKSLILHPGYYFDMEREAFFATSLILEPRLFREAVERYRGFFDALLA